MMPVEIRRGVYCLSAIDWGIRDFHGYSTQKGTTYNSYLVVDEKSALFDSVKKPFLSDLLHQIRAITDPEKIDYLIVNHVEMDHAGCVPELIDIIKPQKIICSTMGKKALYDHFHQQDWPYEVVKTGDIVRLGRKSVYFIETRMLHWPDSMFSYIPEERLLISSDAFGQHWATSERFDDEVDLAELMAHAMKYYANILLLYSMQVEKLLGEIKGTDLAIDMIAPDHGLIWRSHADRILGAYASWARQETGRKALVIFDTMWKSTERMAKAVFSGLLDEGISTKLMDLQVHHRSDVATEALDAKALVFGSSTLNNNMLPRMADMLTYLKGLRPANRIGATFGSYGWSGEAVNQITAALEEMKIRIVGPAVKVRYVPRHDDLRACVELGRTVGAAIKEDLDD